MNKLLDLHLANQIPTKGFDSHYNPLYEQSEKLNNTLIQLEKELQQLTFTSNNFGKLIEQSKGLYDSWDDLKRPEKRAIIKSMTNSIVFNGEEIVFKLKKLAPLPLSKLNPNGSHNDII